MTPQALSPADLTLPQRHVLRALRHYAAIDIPTSTRRTAQLAGLPEDMTGVAVDQLARFGLLKVRLYGQGCRAISVTDTGRALLAADAGPLPPVPLERARIYVKDGPKITIPADDPGLIERDRQFRPLLWPAKMAALYAGQRYDDQIIRGCR